jgi:REP element-mobilizing transposase RayT
MKGLIEKFSSPVKDNRLCPAFKCLVEAFDDVGDSRGHLRQERFSSFVMDEDYLLACSRYIENNPVRAKLVVSLNSEPPEKMASG